MYRALRLVPLVALGLVVVQDVPADQGKAADGWVNLFNGKDLKAWVQYGGRAVYRAEDGQIVGSSVPNTTNSFLCTKKHYADFILDLEFKPSRELNSGVQLRSHVYDEEKTYNLDGKTIRVDAGRVHGYQVEIEETKNNRKWTDGIYDEGRRGRYLYDLTKNEPARNAVKPDDWNKLHVECKGESIKTWLNEIPAADLKDAVTPSGFIGLQVHAVGARTDPFEVRFRNLRIKELK